MPAGRAAKADFRVGKGDQVNLLRPDTGIIKAESGGLIGHFILGVLVPKKTFLLGRGHQSAVYVKRCRRVVTDSAA